MKETMKDIILNASVQMTESCHKTDFIVSRGERCLPDRSCIIRILKDLKRVMFPGYFGEENIALISPQYFIGDRLTDIYGKLKPQIEISLYYRDYEKYTEEEISERAEEVCEEFFKRLPYVQQMLLKMCRLDLTATLLQRAERMLLFLIRDCLLFLFIESLMSCIHRMCHSFLEL